MGPWLVGFSVFFGVPARDEARILSLQPLRPALAPRWVGPRTTADLFNVSIRDMDAVKNTLLDDRGLVPFRCWRRRAALDARAGAGRRRVFRTIFSCRRCATVAATPASSSSSTRSTGPVNTYLFASSGSPGRSGSRIRRGRSRRSYARVWGVGTIHDDHLPRPVLDVPRTLGTVGAARRSGARSSGSGASHAPGLDQPGVLLCRRRARRHRGPECFTTGVRLAAGVARAGLQAADVMAVSLGLSARLDARCTPRSSTSRGFTDFRWAMRPRWRCSSSPSRSS